MAFDIVGDIAIVGEETDNKGAQKLMEKHKNIKVVLQKKSDVEGEYRIRDYEILAEEKDRDFSDIPALLRPRKATATIHKENGCRFKVDPTEAYFSVRLSTERERVTSKVKKGENVLVMFAGVGPYAINIGKNTEPNLVIGVELNPYAVRFFEENIVLNKLEGKVKALEGDVKNIVPKLKDEFDRVVMPLPKDAETFLYLATKKLRKGGTIHLYKILHENDVNAFVQEIKRNISRIDIEIVKAGEYAPGSFRYCFDIRTGVERKAKTEIANKAKDAKKRVSKKIKNAGSKVKKKIKRVKQVKKTKKK
jgi:tRNA (guanine37-N1)-methyltransferase